MKFKEALELVREVKPIYHKSAFGEALDIICSAAELSQQHLTKQGRLEDSSQILPLRLSEAQESFKCSVCGHSEFEIK